MSENHYDIVFLGGGISASMLAISLLRRHSALRLLIVERSEKFPVKPGESSADITGLFLNRFGIPGILSRQLPKAGLRFVFNETGKDTFADADEFSSPAVRSVVNGYHLHRPEFDEAMLEEACRLGAVLFRPAEIISFNYEAFASRLTIRKDGLMQELHASWLVDASGPARIAAKQMNWGSSFENFETASCFAHFENLPPRESWDTRPDPEWEKNAIAPREQSTIHFLRHGCWWWHIRLNDRLTSIGVVYDKSIHRPEDPLRFFEDFIRNDKQLALVTAGSSHGPVQFLPKLPFKSRKLFEPGLALVGDAAAFVDPLFSPGIEFICQQTAWLSELLDVYFTSKKFHRAAWEKYEKRFLRAYGDRVLLYRYRYRLMDSYDLFSCWIRFDFFGYFAFTVIPSVLFPRRIKYPPVFRLPARMVYLAVTGRLLKIVARRKKQGRISSSLRKPVTYSRLAVPAGWKIYFKPVHLFFVWLFSFLRIIAGEWFYFLSGKKRN